MFCLNSKRIYPMSKFGLFIRGLSAGPLLLVLLLLPDAPRACRLLLPLHPLLNSPRIGWTSKLAVFLKNIILSVVPAADIPMKSVNLKRTVLTLALVIVPIALLFFVVAIAVTCSACCCDGRGCRRPRFRWRVWRRRRINSASGNNQSGESDRQRLSTSTKATNNTETDIEFQTPVQGREHV